jgi:hypothetical protein
METRYEQRVVAFLDILGFSELVERSQNDARFFDQLERALRIVERHGRAWAREFNTEPPLDLGFHSHAFSDCIVLSQRGSALTPLLVHTSQLAMALLSLGVLVRGGIAQGLLYHDDAIAFGPALVEAYHLESRSAKFPRILVSQSVYDASQHEIYAFRQATGARMPYRPCDFLRRDADRLYHLDYLGLGLVAPQAIIGANHEALATLLEQAQTRFAEEFREPARTPDVKAKLGWFVEYLNDVVRIRTSRFPSMKLKPLVFEDDEMDPAATVERLRADHYRRVPDDG